MAQAVEEALERQSHQRKRWIDGTVTLSHIIGIAGVGLCFWATTLVNQTKHDGRLDQLEKDLARTDVTIGELNKTCAHLIRCTDRLSDAMKLTYRNED